MDNEFENENTSDTLSYEEVIPEQNKEMESDKCSEASLEDTKEDDEGACTPTYQNTERVSESNKNKKLALLLLLLLLFICLVFLCIYLIKDNKKLRQVNSSVGVSTIRDDDIAMDDNITDKNSDNPLSDRNVFFAGFDNFTVGQDNVVYFENLKENDDIFMAYEVYLGDELIHKTGLIPSGTYSQWTPARDLKPGSYDISIKNVPYYSFDGVNYDKLSYQPVNNVSVTIVE